MTDFVTDLEQDLTWREDELTALKTMAAAAPAKSVRQRALLRALTAMLYAHYEGFCKYCWDLYLEKISRGGVKKKELTRRIKLTALEADIRRIRKCWSDDQILAFMEKFNKTCGASTAIEIEVDTESNLWPKRFKEIMHSIDLKSDYIDTYELQIGALVGRRNGIAHGERLVISDLTMYEEFEHCTFLVLHELVLVLAYAVDNYAYLRPRYRKKLKSEPATNS